MKNAAKALAPSGVCWVASSGMIGGFSPGRVFGPVVGTSAGRVGWVGRGGPENDDDEDAGCDDGATDVDGGRDDEGSDDAGEPPDDDVHAAAPNSNANAANVPINRTSA